MLRTLGQGRGALLRYTGLLVAGLLQAAAIAWPFSFTASWGLPVGAPNPWLQCLAMAVLVVVIHRCVHWRQAAAAGLVFATAWLCGVFWWLFIAMHTYGGLNAVVAGLATFGLAAVLSLFYALACGLFFHLRTGPAWLASAVFAAVWTAAELARGTWLTGFGWGAVGYAHVDGPLAAFIPWVGAYGVGALGAWVASNIATVRQLGRAGQLSTVAVLAVGWAAHMAIPPWTQSTGDMSVTLLQGNIPQDEKFEQGSGVPLALNWYAAQLQANRSSLVVAPETAVPLLPHELPPLYWEALAQRFATGSQAALIGIPLGNFTEGYTNSVVGLAPKTDTVWRYDKHHLVPFGEFIPTFFKWFTQMMHIPLGDFNRGALGQASFAWAGQQLATNICYEDLFGEELAVRFSAAQAAPTIFVNVSNIGWFGDTTAIDQHLNISRMRALEFERPFVRATNTGATVIMDHHGTITAALPRYTRAVLEGSVQGRSGLTPFAWWAARWGLWPVWGIILVTVALAWRHRRKRVEY